MPEIPSEKRAANVAQTLLISALLTTKEAARALRLVPGTLNVWRATRRSPLPFVKVGGRIFYKAEDVQAYINKRTDPGVGEKPDFAAPQTSAAPTAQRKRRVVKNF